MNCVDTRKYLSAFVDDELDVRTNIEVLEHVEICEACAARLEAESRLKGVVSSYVDSMRAPLSLKVKASEALRKASAPGLRIRAILRDFTGNGWVRALTAAASILVVFTLVYKVLLAPPAALNAGTIREHAAVLRDQVPTFFYTADLERAKRLALCKMEGQPSVPLLGEEEFQLVGAGPSEIEFRNVGHFVFRYKAETISMFVFEGVAEDGIGGRKVETRLGTAKIDSIRGMSLLAWQGGDFTYVLVSRLPGAELLEKIGPRTLVE